MPRARIEFNPNRVVTENQFFGRESELDDLAKRIIHGQSVLITGERRIGKTSILKKAYDSIKPDEGAPSPTAAPSPPRRPRAPMPHHAPPPRHARVTKKARAAPAVLGFNVP